MRRKSVTYRAIGEPQLTQEFCKLLAVGAAETLDDARGKALEDKWGVGFLRHPIHAYPWIVPVAAMVMADKPDSQLAIDILMMPDTMFLVRDETSIAGKGLFLVWAGDWNPCEGLPTRLVQNHFDVGGEQVKLTAVQLKSCLRQ